MPKAILYDATQCVGCLTCETACAEQNKLPYNDSIAREKKTSERKFTYVAVKDDDKFMRRMCMHCNEPTCVSVCPVGALTKTKEGPVVYDAGKCMGCRYCMLACPFSVPKYEWSKTIPTVKKCIMCFDRVSKGQQTACAEACPTGATLFGDRETLLTDARKRIADTPDGYINHIYGEKEVGGTSVMMISKTPFEAFGLPTRHGGEPLGRLTGRVLEHVPDVVTVGWAVLGGIWWITNRRDIVASVESNEKTRTSETLKEK